jgi:hypothetical protein
MQGDTIKYWWVNQGDSYEEARKLGALWAPLQDKGGGRQPSWESLDQVRPGDLIFHFAKKKLRGISTALTEARSAEIRIRDKGQWQSLGREVEVLAQDFDFTIDLEEIPLELRIDGSSGIETPFDVKGKVKQGYLFGVPSDVVRFILSKLNLYQDSSGTLENQIRSVIGDFREGTDKTILGTFRREQRALRQSLIGNQKTGTCGICGRVLGTNLLVASHIKPRKSCTEKERLDSAVVMLACVLGCDSLFDKGAIYVDKSGTIRSSDQFSDHPDFLTFVEQLEGKVSAAHTERSAKYFEWHAREVAFRDKRL